MRYYLILFLLISTPLFAWERYAIENPDGSVQILSYDPSSGISLEDALKSAGTDSKPYHKLTKSNVPQTTEDIDFWKWDGSKIVVDADKKQDAIDAKQAKIDSKNATLQKLGITEQEFKELLS